MRLKQNVDARRRAGARAAPRAKRRVLAGVRGNRTHRGQVSCPPLDLKSRRPTSDLRTSERGKIPKGLRNVKMKKPGEPVAPSKGTASSCSGRMPGRHLCPDRFLSMKSMTSPDSTCSAFRGAASRPTVPAGAAAAGGAGFLRGLFAAACRVLAAGCGFFFSSRISAPPTGTCPAAGSSNDRLLGAPAAGAFSGGISLRASLTVSCGTSCSPR